jgi:hypothetical protein
MAPFALLAAPIRQIEPVPVPDGWGDIFADTTIAAAMLDRLLHRSVVINITGDSYRLRAHRARTRQLTKGATPT